MQWHGHSADLYPRRLRPRRRRRPARTTTPAGGRTPCLRASQSLGMAGPRAALRNRRHRLRLLSVPSPLVPKPADAWPASRWTS